MLYVPNLKLYDYLNTASIFVIYIYGMLLNQKQMQIVNVHVKEDPARKYA